MGTPEITATGQKTVSESRNADAIKVQNEDELRLAQMGEYQTSEWINSLLISGQATNRNSHDISLYGV